uniref:Uncharacterized protein n=1 Tax=Arundo donax TaxID=35708 RepID=A0A0A9H7Z3_ARUDO
MDHTNPLTTRGSRKTEDSKNKGEEENILLLHCM